ncbi:hypothetical protein NECID01_1359 [Nematocida sp. AWRm77]|nr:hypothetical protein NECID01_1359 [Nematocida sp. AWRm77]
MWTATTRLHLINAISRYGLRKTSFIGAYLKVYASAALSNWKTEYNKMVREYLKNKEDAESVREYFQRKRAEVIESIIEKKKQEKTKIIERMIYGYDNIENSDEESEEPACHKSLPDVSSEIISMGDSSMSSIWGVKPTFSNPLSTTLLHLSTLSNLPPHLELPGPKPEVFPSPAGDSSPSGCALQEEYEGPFNGQNMGSLTSQEQELEEILSSLENSGYGISVSSVDAEAFERFFKWTVERVSLLEQKKKEQDEALLAQKKAKEAEYEKEVQEAKEALQSGKTAQYSLKEYYTLDFHEYPKKKSSRDKSRWVHEFSLMLARLRLICKGTITCPAHRNLEKENDKDKDRDRDKDSSMEREKEREREREREREKEKEKEKEEKKTKKKISCIKCFSADQLEEELSKDYKPSMVDYIFRAMLFLQTVIFSDHTAILPKEIDLAKSELYKFYEYYRK